MMLEFLRQFKEAAGEAAALELNVRLLADKLKERQPDIDPYDRNMGRLEDLVFQAIEVFLNPGDRDLVLGSRQIRNKLLHGDLYEFREKVREAGGTNLVGSVSRFRLDQGTILPQLIHAAENPQVRQIVSQATSTREVGMYGWFLDLGTAGTFVEAQGILRKANDAVDRLHRAAF